MLHCYVAVGAVPLNPWSAEHEQLYRALRARFHSALDASHSAAERIKLRGDAALQAYEWLRFARLCAWLRAREPDTSIGWSLLIYELDADELQAALEGPLSSRNPR